MEYIIETDLRKKIMHQLYHNFVTDFLVQRQYRYAPTPSFSWKSLARTLTVQCPCRYWYLFFWYGPVLPSRSRYFLVRAGVKVRLQLHLK